MGGSDTGIVSHNFAWPRGACIIEQFNKQGGLMKIWLCIEMGIDSGLEVLCSTILGKAKNAHNLL